MGISEGKPMSNFLSVGMDGIGKLNSPSVGSYLFFSILFEVTCEK